MVPAASADGDAPFAGRRARAWASLSARRWAERIGSRDVTGLLVTSLPNIRYLTGFTGSSAALLITSSGAILATDGRYDEQAQVECPGLPVLIERPCAPALLNAHRLSDGPDGTVIVEADHVTWAEMRQWGVLVDDSCVAAGFVGLQGLVEALREVKDDGEIARVERACRIADEAWERLLPTIQIGDPEIDLARRLEDLMHQAGASGISFDTIVAFAENSARPHHRPTRRPLATGDLVLIDFGALVEGYHSDETRVAVVGAPEPWQRELHALVCAAAEQGRAAVRAGAHAAEVDAAARRVVEEAGLGASFVHGVGHGVGLEIHEAPMMGPRSTGMLAAGSLVTIEPGVYLPGRGGVRIEDIVCVTDDGGRVVTRTSRDLRMIG